MLGTFVEEQSINDENEKKMIEIMLASVYKQVIESANKAIWTKSNCLNGSTDQTLRSDLG